MKVGLVVVSLLLSTGHLSSRVEAGLGRFLKHLIGGQDAYTLLNDHLVTETPKEDVRPNLKLLKDLDHVLQSRNLRDIDWKYVNLVHHAAELDLDDVCKAEALKHLKRFAEIARTIDNQTFKGRKKLLRLSRIITTLAHKTQMECYPELESYWSPGIDQLLERNFGQSLKPLSDFMEHYRDMYEIHNEDAQALSGALDRLNDPTLEASIGPRVKSMLEAMAKKSLEGSRENKAAKAEQLIKNQVLHHCYTFDQQPAVMRIIAPLIDMVEVSISEDFKPDPRINQWAVRFAGCLWFQKVDLHELSKRVARA